MTALTGLARLLLDAFAPRRCAGCGAVAREPVCPGCEESLAALPLPPVWPAGFGVVRAAFPFEAGAREVLHAGKFQGDRRALRRLAELAVDRMDLGARPCPDAVIAVPLGRRRRRQRGYNQAAVVAEVVAAAGAAPLLEGLVRARETVPQTRQDAAARRVNVAGAFSWRGADLGGARLWIVDDVLTTGATVEAAAAALRLAGADRVDAIVLARAG